MFLPPLETNYIDKESNSWIS